MEDIAVNKALITLVKFLDGQVTTLGSGLEIFTLKSVTTSTFLSEKHISYKFHLPLFSKKKDMHRRSIFIQNDVVFVVFCWCIVWTWLPNKLIWNCMKILIKLKKLVCWQTTLSQILYEETLIISHFILLCSVLRVALGNFYIDINITNENNFSVPFSSSPFFSSPT